MNLYTMFGSGIGSSEATSLSERLATWHDTMVAHERKIRLGRTDVTCDDECPHAEARRLWREALETFGDRARDLTFLRTRATTPAPDRASVATHALVTRRAGRSGSGDPRPVRRDATGSAPY